MSTLAIVPARSGSRGIPNKNIRSFMGKPLMAWAIEVGQATCDRTFVSTDSTAYAEVAREYGAPVVMRPKELAADHTPMVEVLRHAIDCLAYLRPDVIVLLQPTQPLRTVTQVRAGMGLLKDPWDSVVSVVEIPGHFLPDFAMNVRSGRLESFLYGAKWPPMLRRQDCRPAYSRDGTCYVMRRDLIERGELYGNCRALVLSARQTCNIDDEADWRMAEELARTPLEQRGDPGTPPGLSGILPGAVAGA